jgi:hypothetical protein
MTQLTRSNASTIRASRSTSLGDLDDFQEVAQAVKRAEARNKSRPNPEKTMSLSTYASQLLIRSCESIIKFADQPAPFENKNAARDEYFATALEHHRYDLKAVIQQIGTDLPVRSIPLYVQQLCAKVLKGAMFPCFIDRLQALKAEQGGVSDEVFAQLVDRREAHREPPPGLVNDYVEIGGVEWQIEDPDVNAQLPLHRRITDGLEELRVWLETLIVASGGKLDERLAFFTEPPSVSNGYRFVNHNGDVNTAMDLYEGVSEAKQKARRAAEDMALAAASARLLDRMRQGVPT